MFSMAVLLHSPGVVYYHLLLRRETRIPRVAPLSFRIGIWDRNPIHVYPRLWEVVDHSRGKMHYTCLIIIHDPGMRPGPELRPGLRPRLSLWISFSEVVADITEHHQTNVAFIAYFWEESAILRPLCFYRGALSPSAFSKSTNIPSE